MTGAATTIGIGLAICAALLYMLLRFVVATPKSANVIEAVSQHAFWTALIAFFASSHHGSATFGLGLGNHHQYRKHQGAHYRHDFRGDHERISQHYAASFQLIGFGRLD